MLQTNQECARQSRTRGESVCPPGTAQRQSVDVAPTVDTSITLPGYGAVRYRLLGASSNPLIVVLGGISADRRVDRWWPDITTGSGALAGQRFRVLSMDWPEWPDKAQAPTVDDLADILAALLDALAISRLPGCVGASFGAMVGLSFAARHAGRIDRLVAISGAHRSTPAATAGRVMQREIIETMSRLGHAARGVALARGLALTGYRPAELFAQQFFDPDPDHSIARIRGYLRYNGTRFAEAFDAGSYLALSDALDRHCVDPAAIECRTELIGARSDSLVPVSQLRELAGAIGMRARLHLIDSPFGHDAFLKSPELLNPLLDRVLGEMKRGQTRREANDA